MESISLEELIMAVRRQSQGFSRGTSAFRGVTHHPSGATTGPQPTAQAYYTIITINAPLLLADHLP